MTPDEFKQARRAFNLTQAEMAHVMGVGSPALRRWEMPPHRKSARPPSPMGVRMMGWFKAGFRPPEWPKEKL